MRARIRHEMKCWPEFFQPTLNAVKRFEFRRDDREGGFQVGDELLLKEWNPDTKEYTGRETLVRVDYIMPTEVIEALTGNNDARDGGFVIMSISLVH